MMITGVVVMVEVAMNDDGCIHSDDDDEMVM